MVAIAQIPMHLHDFDSRPRAIRLLLFLAALTAAVIATRPLLAASGQLEVVVVDKATGQPLACRMHLLGPNKKPRKADKVPNWYDHFVVPGKILLKLPVGNYSFVIERGLEYLEREGHFTIQTFADDSKQVELQRFIDMAAQGWWSGDLNVRRPIRDIELLMSAEDLHVAEVIAWQNDKNFSGGRPPAESPICFDGNRCYDVLAGALHRPGTELLLFRAADHDVFPGGESDYPPMIPFLSQARGKAKVWVDAGAPYGWDVPMLAALGQLDSIAVANANFCRDSFVNHEGQGKPRDRKIYASSQGSALWAHDIYFRLLECGLRIPPSAGSASGLAPNPVGQNRVYVHIDGEFSYDAWWDNFRAGRAVVTNGPLLLPSVEGNPPGCVFKADPGSKLELEIGLTLSTRDPITYLQIVQNGKVRHEVRFDEYAKTGQMPRIAFDRSGWFLIRAITDVPKTFRFAMTAPYYVEIGYERRVSKQAAQFFLDWADERAKQIQLADPKQQEAVMQWHRQAREFWADLVAKANAE